MAAYKTLKGQSIKKVAQDPANPLIGQILYNTTTVSLKVYKTVNGTWASGGARSTNRSLSGQAGTQTAGLSFGGYVGPAFTTVKNTEEYNGTSWTSGGDINSPAGLDSAGGSGSQTAALSASGKSGGTGSSHNQQSVQLAGSPPGLPPSGQAIAYPRRAARRWSDQNH